MTPLSIVGIVAGVVLMAAPALFGYSGDAAADVHRSVGPVIIAVAIMVHWDVLRALRWAAIPAAAALALAPLVVEHSAKALAVGLLAGLVTAVAAPWSGPPTQRTGGGWWALVHDDSP